MDTTDIRPSHYGGPANPYECIKIIEFLDLNFNQAQVLKYLYRQQMSNLTEDGRTPEQRLEDLVKARFYLDREIQTWKDELEFPPTVNHRFDMAMKPTALAMEILDVDRVFGVTDAS